MNKKTLLLLLVFLAFDLSARQQIDIHQTGQMPNHSEWPIPADEPDVYHDENDQEIVIDGTGYVGYYDVEIASTTNWTVYISTQVNGSYDTIDISSLPTGEYSITINSPTGNSFEGLFDTY